MQIARGFQRKNAYALFGTSDGSNKEGRGEKRHLRQLRFDFGVTFGVTLGVKKKKARDLTPLTCAFDGGRYKIRTCDPIRVKDMLYP